MPWYVMKNLNVQYARGVAALMIVVFHEYTQLARLGAGSTEAWFDWLQVGVSLFFVISGFVMWITTSSRHTRPSTFAMSRIARIVPLYWGITTLTLALLLVAPKLLQSTRLDLALAFASYLFVPWPNPSFDGELLPLVVVGWTLNYEMFFYAVFAICLVLPAAHRLAALTLVLAGLVAGGLVYGGGDKWVVFYTNPHLLEFLLGVYIGALTRKGTLASPLPDGLKLVLAIGLGMAAVALPLTFAPLKSAGLLGLGWALLATLIIFCVVMLDDPRRPVHRVPLLIGDASYALYLTHPLTLSAAGQMFARAHLNRLPGYVFLFMLAATSVALLVAIAVHRVVEEPTRLWLKARLAGRASPEIG